MSRGHSSIPNSDRQRVTVRPAAALLCLLIALTALLLAGMARANDAGAIIAVDSDWSATADTLTYSEEVIVDEVEETSIDDGAPSAARFVPFGTEVAQPSRAPLARVGPFHLVSADTVEMIGTVDSNTPAEFARLLAAHPGIRRLVMVECPGSVDEDANHRLARAVRRAGIATHVPAGGSIRSGAVELWLAGTQRTAAADAEFGVHSWRDEDGREARDFAANDPVHAEYLGFYREMGLNADVAARFYALTNSVGFDDVRYLSAQDMARMGLISAAG